MAENEFPLTAGRQARGGADAPPAVTDQSGSTAAAADAVAAPSVAETQEFNDSPVVSGQNRTLMSTLKDFLKSGGGMHRLILVAFLVLFLAAVLFILTSLGSSDIGGSTTRELGRYSPTEIGKVLDFLDLKNYKYKLAGDKILVDVDQYAEINEQMLRQGIALPQSLTDEGDGILMMDSGFGVSQRLESERIKHGRELQLARAIERIDGVEHATVLLAIPKENVFAREQRRPSAAVVVTLKSDSYLSPENVQSIRFMVASSVHNLLSKDVSVTDQMGRNLSADTRQDTAESRLQKEFEMRTLREAQYRDKLDAILGPMLGMGNYSAEVDVTMDTTVQEETSQLYNPDSQAVRSETLKEQQGGSDHGPTYGVPGSLSNQPPANASIPQTLREGTANATAADLANARRETREAVRNYEVDTTVRHTVRPTNYVQRLTVSVAVDYLRTVNADGLVHYAPRPQADLNKIADLVRGGLGLDESRGDFVKVETVSFPHTDDIPPLPWYEREFFYRLVRVGGAVLVILILVIFVIRPMLNRLLRREEKTGKEYDEDLDAYALEGNDDLNMIAKNNELTDQLYSINTDGVIELPNLHKEADLLRAVRTLASNEPKLTAEVLRRWMESDDAKNKKKDGMPKSSSSQNS